MKIPLSLCNAEYLFPENTSIPVILLFCRDQSGNPITVKQWDFRPYFYILKSQRHLFDQHLVSKGEMTSLSTYGYGDEAMKIYTRYPAEVSDYREVKRKVGDKIQHLRTFEADILFPDRFLIDKNIFTGILWDSETNTIEPFDMPSNFRKLYVDIEVFTNRSPDIVLTPDPVIVIGFYDSYTETYIVLTTKDVNWEPKKWLTQEKPVFVMYCKNERSMVDLFIDYVYKHSPDLFLSFSNFDWVYLINRMDKIFLKKEKYKLSRLKHMKFFGKKNPKVYGLQFLDIQQMYEQVFLRGAKWETLHGISERELGEEKLYREESVYDNWIERPERVLIRNLRDVELIRRLDEELQLTLYFDTIRRVIGSDFRKCFFKSSIADTLYLRHVKEEGIWVLPSRIKLAKMEYPGGIVFEVEPGIYERMVVFDWSEMYPSIIQAFNMSYETVLESKFRNEIPKEELERDYWNIDDKFFFKRKPKGWTVSILEKLRPLRAESKSKSKNPLLPESERKFNKTLSDAYKSLINSVYGLWGHAGSKAKSKASRLYHPEVAAATTYVGRTLETDCLKPICEELDYKIVYADTDSIFLQLKTDNLEEETKRLEELISERVNRFLRDRWGISPEDLEVSKDEIYSDIIMFTKKRYVGKTIDGRKVVKGLEIIRKNTAEISATIQDKLSDLIFEKKTNDEIIEFLRDIILKFGELELEEIAIAQQLTKHPDNFKVLSSHLKAFVYSKDVLLLDLQVGKRFYTIYVDNAKIPEKYPNVWKFNDPKTKRVVTENRKRKTVFDKVEKKVEMVAWDRDFHLPDDIVPAIDREMMLEKTIHDKVEPFLDLLGIDWYRHITGEYPKNRNSYIRKLAKKLKCDLEKDMLRALKKNDYKCFCHLQVDCPCTNLEGEIRENGNCHCGLFKRK